MGATTTTNSYNSSVLWILSYNNLILKTCSTKSTRNQIKVAFSNLVRTSIKCRKIYTTMTQEHNGYKIKASTQSLKLKCFLDATWETNLQEWNTKSL